MTDDIEWDFDEASVSSADIEESIARYNAPILEHECGKSCKDRVSAFYHEIESIFDDYEMSQKQRELMYMEIVRARGRDNKELNLIRRFVGTVDGRYYIRMQTVSELTAQRIGDIVFDNAEDADEYYNYAVEVFGFDKGLKIVPENPTDYLFAVDEDEGLFDVDDDDLFDIEDDDDEGLFD